MALYPQKVEWQGPVGPQMWNPAQVKLLALDYELVETQHGLLLSWSCDTFPIGVSANSCPLNGP